MMMTLFSWMIVLLVPTSIGVMYLREMANRERSREHIERTMGIRFDEVR